jgi:hypothetical protein
MRVSGPAAMSDLLGDMVAYRNLRPADPRVPGMADLAPELGLPLDTPRKGDTAYARLVAAMLQAARQLSAPGVALRRLIVVGDTRGGDGGAFIGVTAATGWTGRAFICQEAPGEPAVLMREGDIDYTNRWAALYEFAGQLDAEGFAVDAATAVVLDLDKTLIGARGRNDHLIDEARLRALRASVEELLGDAFDQRTFEQIYPMLNQPRFLPLTGDNQDYVAYICLMVLGGAIGQDALIRLFDGGELPDFNELLGRVGARVGQAAPRLVPFHREIARLVASGDPTPFKVFRRREYRETAARMGCAPGDMPAQDLLREELVLTDEVWQVAQSWRARGALLFGLSDKPDEAALPTAELAGGGALPLHRIRTHIVGDE